MKITIIGTGYVGLVSGACFSEMGNNVVCVDIDSYKIKNLKKGKIPIYEPSLSELIKKNITSKRLSFTTNLKNEIDTSKIFFIAVGTPEDAMGNVNMEYVYNVAKEIGENVSQNSIIVNKSTVPVGTAEKIDNIIKDKLRQRGLELKIHVVSNPEFLKEGNAIEDFMKPDRVIIGSDSKYAIEKLKQIYHPFSMNHNRIIVMGNKEAELTKYASNAMLATKISFINEIAHICDKLNIDIELIRKGMGSDSRIGYSFIYPGVGYGGSCFPKDINAIIKTAKDVKIDPFILNAVVKRNNVQKDRIFKYITKKFGSNLTGKIFTIWGLSFKPDTTDMREAPSINIINSIITAGGLVQAFDPVANNEAANYFSPELFNDKKIQLFHNNYSALENSNALILMTEWKMFRNPSISKMKEKMKDFYIFDGRNQYDPKFMKKNGFEYKGIGR